MKRVSSKKRQVITIEMGRFIEKHQAKISRQQLTDLVNKEFGTSFVKNSIQSYCVRYGYRNINSGQFGDQKTSLCKHQFTDEQNQFLIDNCLEIARKDMVAVINERFNLTLSYYQVCCQCNRLDLPISPQRQSAPIGTIHRSGNNQLSIKVAQPKTWVPLHHYNYEKVHGPIPKGYVIRFLDGDTKNCDIDNLLCVPHSAHSVINKTSCFDTKNIEINKAAMLTATLGVVASKIEAGKPVVSGKKRQQYTPAMREFIEKHHAGITRSELARLFNREFGTSVTAKQMQVYCRHKKLRQRKNHA